MRGVQRAGRQLIRADQAFQDGQLRRIAEVRNDDVDQLVSHLVNVQRPAKPAERFIKQGPAHHRRIQESLIARHRQPDHGQCGQVGIGRGHRLDRDDGVGRPAPFGLQREHRGALPPRPHGVDQAGERVLLLRRAGGEITELSAEQLTGGAAENLRRVPVALQDPAGQVDAQDERPGGRAGHEQRAGGSGPCGGGRRARLGGVGHQRRGNACRVGHQPCTRLCLCRLGRHLVDSSQPRAPGLPPPIMGHLLPAREGTYSYPQECGIKNPFCPNGAAILHCLPIPPMPAESTHLPRPVGRPRPALR